MTRTARWGPPLVVAAVIAALTSVLLAVSTVLPLDLAVYRAAGWSLLHGAGLYGQGFPADLPFTYPPFASWPFVILVPAPWGVTVWCWTALTLLLLCWVIARSFTPALPAAPWRRAVALSVLLVTFAVTTPMSDHIGYGQIDVLLMAACLLDLLGPRDPTRRPAWLPQGVLIGLATAVKLTPGIFVVYLLLTRRWRAAGVAAAAAGAATLVAAAVAPGDSRTFYFDLLFHLDVRVGLGNNALIGNQSLQGALLRLLPAGPAHAWWIVGAAVVGVTGMWAARLAWRRRGDLAGGCAAGLVAVLISPVSWPHYLVWLIPVTGLLLGHGRRPGAVAAAAGVYLLLVGRIHRLGQNLVDTNPTWPLRVLAEVGRNGYVLLCLAMLVWLAWPPLRDRPVQWAESGQRNDP